MEIFSSKVADLLLDLKFEMTFSLVLSWWFGEIFQTSDVRKSLDNHLRMIISNKLIKSVSLFKTALFYVPKYLFFRMDSKLNQMYPAGICLLKVNNRNTRARCEICSELTIKPPEWRHSCAFVVNFEHISHLALVVLLITLNMQLPARVTFRNKGASFREIILL